jgi:hypothetical protein
MSQEGFLLGCFQELVEFTEGLHDLSTLPSSPYASSSSFMQELKTFPHRKHFFFLLSGSHKSPTRWKNFHEVQARYRLGCLLHIHSIFLHNQDNPDELREEWRRIFQNLVKHGIDLVGNVENLRSFMLIPPSPDGKTRFDPGREFKVLRMVSAAKEMRLDTLDKLGNMFFGYLCGRKYEERERGTLWDVKRMEDEIFGGNRQEAKEATFS